jgi:hypothetical protein
VSRSGKRDWRGIGCGALVAAAIAFPLGLFVGGGNGPAREQAGHSAAPPPLRGRAPAARNVYSPRVASDPYVVEEQRRVVEALEVSCRQSGQHCAEAEQARRRIEEAASGL